MCPEKLDHLKELKAFAEARDFFVTSTTGGKHNKGSLHGQGYAIDVRTHLNGKPVKSAAEIRAFIRDATDAGIKVSDERVRPKNQKEWSAPHLHLAGLRRSESEALKSRERFAVDTFGASRDLVDSRMFALSSSASGDNKALVGKIKSYVGLVADLDAELAQARKSGNAQQFEQIKRQSKEVIAAQAEAQRELVMSLQGFAAARDRYGDATGEFVYNREIPVQGNESLGLSGRRVMGGTTLGIEIEPQLTRAQQATKDATERMGESWRDLFVRRENFEQELSEIYQRASIDRQQREMDYIRDASEAEARLHNRRIENVNIEIVAARRRAAALTEAERLSLDRQQLEDEVANFAVNSAARVEVAQLRAIRNTQDASEAALVRRMENEMKLARQMDVDSTRMNDPLIEFLASQKTLQESLQDFRTSGVKTVFDAWDSSVDKLTKRFGFMSAAVGDLLKNLGKLVLSNFIQKLTGVGGQSGGAQSQGGGLTSFAGGGGSSSQGGGGFSLSSLFGGGRSSNANGTSGGGILGTIRNIFGGKGSPSLTPSFNPSSSAGFGMPVVGGAPPLPPQFMEMAGGVRLPIAQAMPRIADVGTGASSTGSATSGMGGLSGMAGAGLMAGGGMLGGMLGKGAVGQLAGSVGGTLLGGMGAALLNPGTMAAMFSNPVTAIVAGGLLSVALLSRVFANRTEKALKKEIMAVHQVKMDDMKMLTQIKGIGEQQFGKGKVKDRVRETVQLEQVKELIAAHAEATGQTSKLVTAKQAQDPTSAMNNFVRRLTGGIVPFATMGRDYVPAMLDGGEYVANAQATEREGHASFDALNQGRASIVMNSQRQSESASQGSSSSSSTGSSGGNSGQGGIPPVLLAALIGAIERNSAAVEKIETADPDAQFVKGAQRNPTAVAEATNKGMSRSTTARNEFGSYFNLA